MTGNSYHLRRELAAIAILLALATPTGARTFISLSNWGGQMLAKVIAGAMASTVAQQPEHDNRQEVAR